MTTPNSIETVALAFRQWRDNRSHIRARCPDALRQSAVELLQDLPVDKVSSSLAVSSSLLRRWRRKLNPPPESFVALPDNQSPMADPDPLQLSVCFANGARLSVSGKLSHDHLQAVIRGLSEGGAVR